MACPTCTLQKHCPSCGPNPETKKPDWFGRIMWGLAASGVLIAFADQCSSVTEKNAAPQTERVSNAGFDSIQPK